MILVLNCGSQSIKWKIFNKGLGFLVGKKIEIKNFTPLDKKPSNGARNFKKVLTRELKKIKILQEGQILAIGHRVVHGGKKFREPIEITRKVLRELGKYNRLAPLHNPFNVLGIKIAKKIFPKTRQIAVFDTGFYKDLPERSYIYALPWKLALKHGFRRFGFHGISHEYAVREAAKKINKPFNKLKIISCHLGGGSSITAVKFGRAVDTSMGFTPLEGLVMMTRSGDIDPGIILEMASKKLSVDKILNFQSGIKGISGFSDMRKVLKEVERKNKKAKLALEIFCYHIQKYIGAYFAVLGGCDALVFTGMIGFGSKIIRDMICKDLNILKNTKVFAVETDEELTIARKVKSII